MSKRDVIICIKDCKCKIYAPFIGNVAAFKKNKKYLLGHHKIQGYLISNKKNGKNICHTSIGFIKKYFIYEKNIVKDVDILFDNIFFDHG